MHSLLWVLSTILLVLSSVQPVWSQSATQDESHPATVFPHEETDRVWLSGQANIIFQTHGRFRSPYSGDHSLRATHEAATSTLLTLYTGVRLARGTEVMLDVESAGGRGISDALGLAGFTDLDVVRNPDLGAAPYLARLMVHHTLPLGVESTSVDPGPLGFARELPVRRLEFRAGKFGMADFFDLNAVGSDSHLQFMNWTVDNNGAYDYAADTRGYTWGALVEYHERLWALRFGEMLMPKVANGLELEWDVERARAENMEFEHHLTLPGERRGTIRLLSYVNHANMGDYREAVQRYLAGIDSVPTIENTRRQGRIKYGFGVNGEQDVSTTTRAFARWGWNEPHFESFAYTEVNNTFAIGADQTGEGWRRAQDKVGAAFVSNGISDDHQDYLRLGGSGFLLGDGTLTYGRENIFELYYTAHLSRGVFASGGVQHIAHPGYNRDRGPVTVAAVRLHVDF